MFINTSQSLNQGKKKQIDDYGLGIYFMKYCMRSAIKIRYGIFCILYDRQDRLTHRNITLFPSPKKMQKGVGYHKWTAWNNHSIRMFEAGLFTNWLWDIRFMKRKTVTLFSGFFISVDRRYFDEHLRINSSKIVNVKGFTSNRCRFSGLVSTSFALA